MSPTLRHRSLLLLALGLGIVLGLLLYRIGAASEERMPRTPQELETFIWQRVEACHATDGYLRCPTRLY